MARSSSGLGHRPLKAEITGSNPVRATKAHSRQTRPWASAVLQGYTGVQRPLTMQSTYPTAPELAITRWFNTADNPTLEDLRGEVVVIEAFQMLCPGCVSHGLPQAKRIQESFRQRRHRARGPLRFRAPRRDDPRVARGVPVRVPHHVPRRRRRPRPWRSPCPSRWAGTSCGAPRAWL